MNGTLGTGMSVANTNVTIYTTGPSSKVSFCSFSVNCVNTADTPTLVRIGITKNQVPELSDWIEYDYDLCKKSSVIERTALVCGPAENIVVYADTSNVSVRVNGLEQSLCSAYDGCGGGGGGVLDLPIATLEDVARLESNKVLLTPYNISVLIKRLLQRISYLENASTANRLSM